MSLFYRELRVGMSMYWASLSPTETGWRAEWTQHGATRSALGSTAGAALTEARLQARKIEAKEGRVSA